MSALPPVRRLVHPGPVSRERWEAVEARGRGFRVRLRAGLTLREAVAEALAAEGATCAAVTLLGGVLARAVHCLGAPKPGIPQVATFTPAVTQNGPVRLLAGAGTLGLDEASRPLLHAHALLADAAGRVTGGHLLPDETIVGEDGPVAYLRAFEGATMRLRHDPEIMLNVLRPGPHA